MDRRRLLMITYHFPPSAAVGGHRLLGFCRHLPAHGWSCSVVAPPELPWEPVDLNLVHQIPTTTRVERSPYPEGWLWKPVRRIAPYGVWLPRAWKACCREIRGHPPLAILTSGPPHVVHLIGLGLRRKYGVAWLADFRDPWIAGDQSPRCTRPSRWEPRAEALVIRTADAIIVNTPRARDQLAEAYPEAAARIVAITNGYDPESYPLPRKMPSMREFVEIVHPGLVYANRDPAPFFEAMQTLASKREGCRPVRARFIGCRGERAEHVLGLACAAGISDSVSVEGQIPHAQALESMCLADILLLLDSPGRLAGVPAKLYEYVGAGRPVLALAEPGGDVEWVLRRSGLRYRIAPPRDAQAIAAALDELIRESCMASPAPADHAGPGPFTRQSLSSELAEILELCLSRRSQAGAPRRSSPRECRL